MSVQEAGIGSLQIDRDAQVVLRGGEPLPIGQRGFRLLELLLRRPGEVITKAELMDAAWPGLAVEESNLSVQIAALRKTLGPPPAGGDWIVTVPRIGYRLIGRTPEHHAGVETSKGKSIAVLPFVNLSADPEQAFFADGLAEEVITALSKIPGLLVIARNSSFAYRDASLDIRKIGEELDVRYVLTGSVRRNGQRLRMSVQLVDAESGRHVWAESYDRELTDVFAVQDDVTQQIVSTLNVRLHAPGADGRPSTGTHDVEALDLLLRGRGVLNAPNQTAPTSDEGIALLQRATKRDPNYVDAHVMLVIGYATAYSSRWADDPKRALSLARASADRAVALAPDDSDAHAARALVAMLEKDHERLRVESERAISLNPPGGFANVLYGGYLVNDGRALEAIPYYERAIHLDPGMTHLFVHHLATAYLFAERYETAAALFRTRIELSPGTDMSRAYLCAALGHLGEHEEARKVWAELMAISPNYSLRERLTWWHYRNPADPARMLEGLRRAGLPA
jgi:TolB-like protein